MSRPPQPIKLSPEIELETLVPLDQAAKLRGDMSVKTLRTVLKDHLVQVAPNRVAVRLKHVLALDTG
jgi:hypothetical protein